MISPLIKSKSRVKEFAEVFTPQWVVRDMVKTVGEDYIFNPTTTILEPSVGTGNFFVYILENRLSHLPKIDSEENTLKVLQSVESLYGIEIQEDNVEECRENLWQVCENFFKQSGTYLRPNFPEFEEVIRQILKMRIRHGDFLKITGVKDENGKTLKKNPYTDEEIQARLYEFFNK